MKESLDDMIGMAVARSGIESQHDQTNVWEAAINLTRNMIKKIPPQSRLATAEAICKIILSNVAETVPAP